MQSSKYAKYEDAEFTVGTEGEDSKTVSDKTKNVEILSPTIFFCICLGLIFISVH